jgi:hypothetical protein
MINNPLHAEVLAEAQQHDCAEESATDDGMPEPREREQPDVIVSRAQAPAQWIRHIRKLVGTERGFMRR